MTSPLTETTDARVHRWWARAFAVGVVVLGLGAQSWDDRRERGVLALEQAVRDARTDVQALLVASHPDDRYVMLAAWLRYRHGIRVATLLATRGEGGQNAWGPETGSALARIRTHEAEACAARLGIDLHYLNAPDRGFCRTAEETLEQWNRGRTIEDMARVIREVQPDVVLTTHHGRETHGHDLALLALIPPAVELAADPSFATQGLEPFVVDRLFHGRPPALEDVEGTSMRLALDEVEPMRGRTYRRLAYDAMTSEHRSQQPYAPMATLFDPELPLTPVRLRRGSGDPRIVEGYPTFWDLLDPPRDEPEAKRRRSLALLFNANLNPTMRQSQLHAALELIGALRALEQGASEACAVRIRRRLEALERVVIHSLALTFDVDTGGIRTAVAGEQLDVVLSLRKSGERHADIDISNVRFEAMDGCRLEIYGAEQGLGFDGPSACIARGAVLVPAEWALPDSRITQLYQQSRFVSPVQIRCELTVGGQMLSIEHALPVEVLPPVTLESIPGRILIPADRNGADFRVRIRRNTRQPVETRLAIESPPGMVVRGQPREVSMAPFEPEKLVTDLSLRVPPDLDAPVRVILASLSDQVLRIPVHRVDVRVVPGVRVGLVPGQDDTTKTVLKSLLGDRLRLIDQEFVLEEDLSSVFDCIVVDVRAGSSIRGAFHRLLEFAEHAGKRLVVFHHKPGEFNFEEAGFVGYPFRPFRLGRGRVTQEDAPVQLLDAEHPLLTFPNRIGAEDWDGWVHERGLYFPAEFGAEYTPLLAMADQGVPGTSGLERGSLLHARCGEGEFVYCALSLYRQLKNLHPGAVRLLANLISPHDGS